MINNDVNTDLKMLRKLLIKKYNVKYCYLLFIAVYILHLSVKKYSTEYYYLLFIAIYTLHLMSDSLF